MAKDEFIGIRVSKEFKKFLQRESKRKGMSLSEYIEYYAKDEFLNIKKHIQNLIERAKEDRPEFWEEAEKVQFTKDFENTIPIIMTDLLHPLNNNPYYHPILVLNSLTLLFSSTIMHFDTLHENYRRPAYQKILYMGEILAKNLNKIQSKNKEEQEEIISELKGLIESFVFSFTSMAFAKDSFVKIKEELDKTEKVLLKDIEVKGKR
jgi:hypothetical protein